MKPQGRFVYGEGDTPTITFTIEDVDLTGNTLLVLLLEAPQGLVTVAGSLVTGTPQGSTVTFTFITSDLTPRDGQLAVVEWIVAGVRASAEGFFIDVKRKPA